MKVSCHKNVPKGYYGKLAEAWLQNNTDLYRLYPVSENSLSDIEQQYTTFNIDRRNQLADIITQQYEGVLPHENVRNNIQNLRRSNTFTVTTGQQLHVFLGPAFFIYKITSVIRQAKRLQKLHPDNHYVPVFWMASEDHDIAEINHIKVFGRTYTWETSSDGPTGRLSTSGLRAICDELLDLAGKEDLPPEVYAIFSLFKEAYTRFDTLSEATRFILNQLFGEYGLVVMDADHSLLKSDLKPIIQADVLSDSVFNALQSSSGQLKTTGFSNQVNPRKTHFFLLKNRKRLRIDKVDNGFKLHPSDELISAESMLELIEKQTSYFSPNALLRPVYQQIILPNVAYVCGPAELHYWHQLYPVFVQEKIVAPLLLLRDSYLAIDSKIQQFLTTYDLTEIALWDGFEAAAEIVKNKLTEENSIGEEIELLKVQTDKLMDLFFQLKYKNIKDLRTKSLSLISDIEKANKSLSTDFMAQPAYEHIFKRLNKIIQTHYNVASQQERSVSWVEMLLKYRINEFSPLMMNQDESHCFGYLSV
jgi:bacillithiol biosynthesis cysteine-adding enzyme BshC